MRTITDRSRLYAGKEHRSLLLRVFGNSPNLRIIDLFLDNPLFDFTKKEVIEALGMSKQTFYKYFAEIEESGMVTVSRRIGKAKLYKINPENPWVTTLRKLETTVSLKIAGEETQERRRLIERPV